MKRLKRLAERLAFTRTESAALVVIASLYLVGFTWRYVQQNTAPFDPQIYAGLDSLIASGGLTPLDTFPKPNKHSGELDSLGADTLGSIVDGLLDVNHASLRELISLPGIGPALATRIIEYRERAGPFSRIEDLIKVKGIGPAKLERISRLVTAQ
jgi:competence ComEA-like helix-hairpin-helix protein